MDGKKKYELGDLNKNAISLLKELYCICSPNEVAVKVSELHKNKDDEKCLKMGVIGLDQRKTAI